MEKTFIKEERFGNDGETTVEDARVFLDESSKVEHFVAENNDKKNTRMESSHHDSKYILPDIISSCPVKREKVQDDLNHRAQQSSSNDHEFAPCSKPAQSEEGIFGYAPSDVEDLGRLIQEVNESPISKGLESEILASHAYSSRHQQASNRLLYDPLIVNISGNTTNTVKCYTNKETSVVKEEDLDCGRLQSDHLTVGALLSESDTQNLRPVNSDVLEECGTSRDSDSTVVSSRKPVQCYKCNKRFSRKGNLTVHLRTHTGERPYACEECNVKFTDRRYLNRHIKSHEGVRPFACEECGQKFTLKSTLKTHRRLHTGVKPFKCDRCEKGFFVERDLKRHLLGHAGVETFQCEKCAQTFSDLRDLKQHERTHTRSKPAPQFSCSVSENPFSIYS